MNSIRCIIVDDEPLARELLETRLAERSEFEVVGRFGEARAALEAVRHSSPQLIFLDIRMPGLSGMEFLATLHQEHEPQSRPYVILVTAFDRYALQAFEYEALDYLVKPFDEERFLASLERAQARILGPSRATVEADPPAVASESILVRSGSAEWALDPHEIVWIEAADHYLYVHVRQRSHLIRMTMSAIEERLPRTGFVRVHRGALVNTAFLERLLPKSDGGRWLVLRDGSRVPVSRRRWPRIRECLLSQA